KISIVNTTVIFYIDQMISDLMYLMASYHKGEVRYFYLNIRSVIEAFSRLFSEVETSTNRITMTTLLDNIANYITLNDLRDSKEDSLDYPRLKGLYRECCLYVHGNINAKYSLIEFYNELLNEEITSAQKRKMSNDIKFLASILTNISCYRYSITLNDVFFRGKNKLGYLIGEFGVKIVKSYSNFIFSCLSGGESIYNVVLTSKKGSKLKVIDFNSDEYEMSYCFRPDTLFFEDYDVYSKCILKKKSYR
ncbi:hypothetical protein HRE55_10585, partial [Enterococcus faecalis]|nr:hypothetical protein [Enterococcus faecalis]